MSKAIKTTLIVAGSLLIAGILIFSLARAFGAHPGNIWNDWNFPWKINIGTHNVSGYKTFDNAYAQDGKYAVSAEGLSGLDLKWVAGSAEVSVYDGSEITFTETSSEMLAQNVALRYGVENGTLYIQYCAVNAPNDLPMKTLDVKIPASLAADMAGFNFSGASAGLTVSGLTVNHINCNGVSGHIDASGLTAQSVDIGTTSGEIRYEGSYLRMSVNTVSGMVRINSTGTAQETRVDTTSGAMAFAGKVGVLKTNSISGEVFSDGAVYADSADIDTTSGGVSLQFAVRPADLKIDTISGSITLTLPFDSGFTLEYSSVSGGMDCAFSVVMSGNKFITGDGTGKFDIGTVSGGLRIKTPQQ